MGMSGKAGDVQIGGVSVQGIKEWSIDYKVAALDDTDFADAGVKSFIAGCSEWSISFGGDKIIAPSAIGTIVAITLKETQTSTQKFTGNVLLTGFTGKTVFDGLVLYNYTGQGTGALTIPTA